MSIKSVAIQCNENIELMILMSKEKPDSLSELAEISGHHIREL